MKFEFLIIDLSAQLTVGLAYLLVLSQQMDLFLAQLVSLLPVNLASLLQLIQLTTESTVLTSE